MLRQLAERLSRGRVIRRTLPKEFGSAPLYVSPDSQLKYLKFGRYAFDAELLRVAYENVRPGMVVWDIGANVGVFTLAAASLSKGPVLAVEADIWLAQLLTRSAHLRRNRSLDVRVIHAAIAERNGLSTLLISARGRASNALALPGADARMGGVRRAETVATLTLDTLLDFGPPPDFVKIDIEGAEREALEGARRLLLEVRPVIYLEVSDRGRDWVAENLRTMSYVLYDGASATSERTEIRECAFNTLAIPRSLNSI